MAKKIKCSFQDCKAAAQRIAGDCTFCEGHFCNNHRLLEDHKCRNLDDVSSFPGESDWWLVGLSGVLPEDTLADLLAAFQCKREAFEQNAMQLNKERTQVIKTV
ncbi:AN1-type zinc finger protein TMC1 [Madurella mycetomatis]|uniref:AN1-type zinc finger protein TMC1 n=1 Tax=Madurella mycetomatis TaxID=100816 RepID=A0A175VR60_9PEZI|nr:AN1-type zinc finger protein TMC1 [Madurella mycetomatis]